MKEYIVYFRGRGESAMEENLIKKWESLTISNDFLFGKVMSHPGLCQKLLERIFPDDYSGQLAHALKRVQRMRSAVWQSLAAVRPRPSGMG